MSIFKGGLRLSKVTRSIDLGEINPGLEGKTIHVWVSLTKEMHTRFKQLQVDLRAWQIEMESLTTEFEETEGKERDAVTEKIKEHADAIEKINDGMYTWYSIVWSQNEDEETHATAKQIRELAKSSSEQDNSVFWRDITHATQALIIGYRNGNLKK